MPSRTSSVQPNVYTLSVKLTSGTALVDQPVKFINRTTKEYRVVKSRTGGEAVLSMGELSSDGTDDGTKSGFSNADVIEINVIGDGTGTTTHTINTANAGADVTIVTVNVTASDCAAVNL